MHKILDHGRFVNSRRRILTILSMVTVFLLVSSPISPALGTTSSIETVPLYYLDDSDVGLTSIGGPQPLGAYAIQVRNPTSLPRPNEVIRYTLNLLDGDLQDETKFTVNDTVAAQEVLSGSLASTVVRYPSNFVKKVDIVFQDDFLPDETKNYQIITNKTTALSGDLSYSVGSPAWVYIFDGPRQYQIQGTQSPFSGVLYQKGVYVDYINGSSRARATILTRVGGNQLSLDQTAFQLGWGAPTSMTIDNNNVMISVRLRYNNPKMINWGVGSIAELFKDVDFISADITINIYNDKEMVETFSKKKFHEKVYNHNGVVMEFSILYDGDGEYLTIFGNSGHTVMKEYTKLLTWERARSPFYGVDVGSYSVPTYADINGDSRLDLIVGMGDGTLNAYIDVRGATETTPRWSLNPSIFMGIDVGNRSAPVLGDLDGDNDFDLIVGNENGSLWYYNNTGTPTSPIWTSEPTMFTGIDVGDYSIPTLANLDGDSDQDLVVGNMSGELWYFNNTGTPLSPIWTSEPAMFVGIDVEDFSAPEFVDLNGDNDYDLVVGNETGFLWYFNNTGNSTNPIWTSEPGMFAGIDVGDYSTPEFGNLDGDSDYDMVVGNKIGSLVYFQNIGDLSIPIWSSIYAISTGIDVGNYSIPAFADINGDGLSDMILGMENGTLTVFHNTGTSQNPVWTHDSSIYSGIDVGDRSAPALADLDNDGDNDTVVGNSTGELWYLNNTGDAFSPVWANEPTMFAGVDVGDYSTPELGDVESDGDYDLVIGKGEGNLSYYENTGNSSVPTWSKNDLLFHHLNEGPTRMPSTFVKTDQRFSAPVLADVDTDGDLDFTSGVEISRFGCLVHFENVGNATNPSFTRLRPDLFGTVRGGSSTDSKDHTSPVFEDIDGDSDLDLVLGTKDGRLSYFQNNGLMPRSVSPVNNMQPLENGSYRFYLDQDSNDGPYATENYSTDFLDYYVLAKPSTQHAILRYVPQFSELVHRDRYGGDQYIWAGGNVSYYPYLSDEDGSITRGIQISRGFSDVGLTKGVSGGTFISQTGTAGGFVQVPMTAMSYDSREVLLTQINYTTNHTVYDDMVEILKTPMEVISSPDLEIVTDDITFTPGVAGEGDLVTVTAIVKNIGGSGANNVDVEFYHDTINPGNLISTENINIINASESKSVNTLWDSTGYVASNLFHVVLDPSDSVIELDEDNNVANKTLEVMGWKLGSEMFRVSTDLNNSMNPTIAIDASGKVWIAYHTYTANDDFEIFSRNYDGAWSSEDLLVSAPKHTSRPFVVANGNEVWLVYSSNIVEYGLYIMTKHGTYYWSQKFDIWTKKFDGVLWQPEQRISQAVENNKSHQVPSAVIDDSGNLWVAYRHTHFQFYTNANQMDNIPYQDMNITAQRYDGAWSGEMIVANEVGSEGWYNGAVLGNDGSGNLWVIYEREMFNDHWDLWGRYYNGTGWSMVTPITSTGYNSLRPSVTTDSSGNLWVVYETDRDGNKEIYANYYDGAWSLEQRLTYDGGEDIKPYVTSDKFGNIWVAWESDRDGNKNIYLKRFDGNKWSPDIPLTTDEGSDTCSFITSSPINGDVWVAWETDRNGHGNKDIYTMRLYINDTSPPITNISIGNPKYLSVETYVTSSSPISLNAYDGEGTGVASTWFRTWNSTSGWTQWNKYSSSFFITGDDGKYYIEYNSTDNVGITEPPNNASVYLDNTLPVTTLSLGMPIHVSGGSTYFNSSTSFTLSPDDSGGSGINTTWFRIWEPLFGWSTWQQYSSPFTISGADGTRYIEYNSSDNLGHIELPENYTTITELYLDNTPPTTTLSIGTPQFASGGTTYFTSDTEFNLSYDDGTGSGVDSSWFKIWNSTYGWSPWTNYMNPFTITGVDGPRYIEYNSTDNLTISEVPNNYFVTSELYLDNTAPTTTLTIGAPNHTSGGNLYVTSATQFNITADDPTSDIWHKIDPSGVWTIYTNNFIIGTEGAYIIYYNATDTLGNVESPPNTQDVIVDLTAPDSTIDFNYIEVDSVKYVSADTSFILSAVDPMIGTFDGSGVSKIWYWIDSPTPPATCGGGQWIEYTGGFDLSAEDNGYHVIYFCSVDNLGNDEAPEWILVFLDEEPPIADAGPDVDIVQGDTHTFDGSQSYDNSGSIFNYTWNFTYDGQTVLLYSVGPSHQFDEIGSYEVTLTVTDVMGNGATDTMWVNVTLVDDTDGDGLNDSWEQEHFGDLDESPANDTDNDGLTNLEEQAAGTIPDNPDSDGDGLKDGEDPNPLVAEPEDKNFLSEYWWLLLVIVIVIVLIIVLLLMFKRKKPEEVAAEEEEESPEPEEVVAEEGERPLEPEELPQEGEEEDELEKLEEEFLPRKDEE